MLRKPLPELKEAFVRNRFAEETHFGNPNIDRWLEDERTAEKPDEAGWNRCIQSSDQLFTFAADPLALLRRYAHSSRLAPTGKGEDPETVAHCNHLTPLLSGLDETRLEVYYPDAFGPIIVSKDPLQTFWFDRDPEKTTVTVVGELPSLVVMNTIFATWRRWTPKAIVARTFLCEHLAQTIRRVRDKAEFDFDGAVAVSSNGAKIVIADWVSILDGEREVVYRADVFAKRKIERDSEMKRDVFPYYQPYRNAMWDCLMEGFSEKYPVYPQNFYKTVAKNSFLHLGGRMCTLVGRFFFTHRQFCQEPLPSEGIMYDSVRDGQK